MPRKKATKESKRTGRRAIGDMIVADIVGHFDKNKTKDDIPSAVTNAADGLSAIRYWIPTGCFPLDIAIGRDGLPSGRLVVLQGANGAGKTSTCVTIGAQAQKMGGIVIFVDIEEKFDRDFAAGMELYDSHYVDKLDLDVVPLILVHADHFTDVFQKMRTAIEKAREIDPDCPIVIIWDSVAATPTKAEFDSDFDDMQPGGAARAVSKYLRKFIRYCSVHDVLFLAINQEKEKIGGMAFADNTATIAERPLAFHATVRLSVRRKGYVGKEKSAQTGTTSVITVIKNNVAPPFRKAEFNIMTYGKKKGIDNDAAMLDMAAEWKIVSKTGGRYKLKGSDNGFFGKDFASSPDYDEIVHLLHEKAARLRGEALGTLDVDELPNGPEPDYGDEDDEDLGPRPKGSKGWDEDNDDSEEDD
jgi:recombination protein RecA